MNLNKMCMQHRLIHFFSCLMTVLICTQTVHSQGVEVPGAKDSTLTYFEHLPGGKTRFYFDSSYYLSDKYCPFTSIERDAGFDTQNNRFEGDFVDYDLQGNILLTGSYRQGLKEGEFRAYHLNGQLKWEGEYVQDQPTGMSHYYYPDGLPMISVYHGDQGIEIRDFWDQKGEQRVRNGRGRYEMRIELDGYNEYGAQFLNRRGRIRNGKPHGLWMVDFVYGDRSTEFIGSERYQEGRLDRSHNRELYDLIGESVETALLPLPWFLRGEILIGKKCTIDEQTGFTNYLLELLESWFEGEVNEWMGGVQAKYQVSLDETGQATTVEVLEDVPNGSHSRTIQEVLKNVWWIPSWKESAYVADTLEVSFYVYHDPGFQSLRFGDLLIVRQEGN